MGDTRDTGLASAGPGRRRFVLAKRYTSRSFCPKSKPTTSASTSPSTLRRGTGPSLDTTRDAVERLREQRPDAVDVLCQRVGYRALRSFGAGSLRRTG